MSNFIKLKTIILTLLMIFSVHSIAANTILPLPKPSVDKETKDKVTKKKIIYPQKKPSIQSKEVKNEINKAENTNISADKKIANIYPQKKPIIVKKENTKIITKSTVLSKKDFDVAKIVFDLIDNKKWKSALKELRKTRDKDLYRLVNYIYLKKPSNSASFYDYVTFINNNPNYPRISRLRYLAEHKININSSTPRSIIKWFDNTEPLSGFGKIKLGESYMLEGKLEEGSKLIKEGWIKAKLSKSQLRYLRKKYKKIITVEDNVKRVDWHAWEGKHWDVKRMLRYLPSDYTTLYNARQILISQSYGVDAAINNIDSKFKNDIGLKYDRLKWRRRRGRVDQSLEILLDIPKDPKKLIQPEKWWKERSILSRSLVYKKKFALAYKVSSNHSMIEGPAYAEAEWLSGWISLTFLEDPNLALQHFKNFYNNVGYPISLSRGAFWIAKTYKEINNKEKSNEWYAEAAKYLNTYYGQLAFIEIYPGEPFTLEKQRKIEDKFTKEFNKNSLVKVIKILNDLNKNKYAKDFLKHLALSNIESGSEILSGNLAVNIGRYDYSIQIAKAASYEKRFHNKINYPVIETPNMVNKKKMAKPELILAVIRQESEFDSKANSYVGAKGMMQLMTYTAKLVAKQAKLPYSKSKLHTDPEYNIKLGSYYLSSLLEEYEGSYPFALAAYNAGPKRVKYWKKINGNPQIGDISYIDWVELVKFKETRNYIQRVLENVNVYRYILSGKPVTIYNFFEDKKLY